MAKKDNFIYSLTSFMTEIILISIKFHIFAA